MKIPYIYVGKVNVKLNFFKIKNEISVIFIVIISEIIASVTLDYIPLV